MGSVLGAHGISASLTDLACESPMTRQDRVLYHLKRFHSTTRMSNTPCPSTWTRVPMPGNFTNGLILSSKGLYSAPLTGLMVSLLVPTDATHRIGSYFCRGGPKRQGLNSEESYPHRALISLGQDLYITRPNSNSF